MKTLQEIEAESRKESKEKEFEEAVITFTDFAIRLLNEFEIELVCKDDEKIVFRSVDGLTAIIEIDKELGDVK